MGSSRFPDVLKTLHRTFDAHEFFVEKILLPGLKDQPLIDKAFLRELTDEHKDVDRLIKAALDTALTRNKALDAYILQLQTIIEANFLKEDEALYLLADELLPTAKLEELYREMDRRKEEVREPAGG